MTRPIDIVKHTDQNGYRKGSTILDVNGVPSSREQQFQQQQRPQWMRFFYKRGSLRVKAIALSIAIGTLPVLLIGAIAYQLTSQSLTRQIVASQEELSDELKDELLQYIETQYSRTLAVASLPILTDPVQRASTSAQEKQAVLDEFFKAYRNFNRFAVADLNGTIITQTTSDQPVSTKPGAVSDRVFFQGVLQTKQPYISQPNIGRTSGKFSVQFAVPIKDAVSGKMVAILWSSITVEKLGNLLKNLNEQETEAFREYYLVDRGGLLFYSPEGIQIIPRNSAGKAEGSNIQPAKAEQFFPNYPAFKAANQITTEIGNRVVTYLPLNANISNSPAENLDWSLIISSDRNVLFAPQVQLLQTITLGTAFAAIVVGMVAALLANRATRPILAASMTVAQIGQGDLNARLSVQGSDELAILGNNINTMALQLKGFTQQQAVAVKQANVLAMVTGSRTVQEAELDLTLNRALEEARQLLQADRMVIYRFQSDGGGWVSHEAVTSEWTQAVNNIVIHDPCIPASRLEAYRQGQTVSYSNVMEADLHPEHLKLLQSLQVKAHLILPILQDKTLFGLLVVHHCAVPHEWPETEVSFGRQLANQLGLVFERFTLLRQQQALTQQAQGLAEDQRQQKETLQQQLVRLLGDIEGATSGDLTVHAEVTTGEIGTVADFFNSVVENLRYLVIQVKQSATQVNRLLSDNEQAMQHLAEDASQQSRETLQTLDAVEKMVQSIQQVAENAQKTAEVARAASNQAEVGEQAMDLTVQNILNLRETVDKTTKKVRRLGETSQQISKVVALINQISMQTNLLAINAGIEATRAGEKGQGFGVVAREVKNLAAQATTATQEIEQIVDNIQRETFQVVQAFEESTTQVIEGTQQVEDAKNSLNTILQISREIDQLVQSISIETVSQAYTSETVAKLMKDIAQISEKTSNSSRDVSDALKQTVSVAQELQTSVEKFTVESY
jgi:twitching motility protein PilJ